MKAQRPQKPQRPQRTHRGPATKWTGFKPMYDFWGNELKRFYKLETLQSATNGMLELGESFITGSVKSVLGAPPIIALHFELFQEGRYQLIFRLQATNAQKRRAQFGFVVAKNHEEASEVARTEHMNLTTIHPRAPEQIVKPFRGGTVYLPDRHGRKDKGRSIYAYLTQWLPDYDELGVDQNLQLIVNVQRRHTFTLVETEALKTQMIEIVAKTYDAKTQTCMTMPEIASGDFVVKRGRSGSRLKLIACRKLMTRVTPAKVVSKMLTAHWPWGERVFELRPAEPEHFLAGLVKARGEEEAHGWVRQHGAARRSGKVPGRRDEYMDVLEELVR